MAESFIAATRSQSRVFVSEGRPGPTNPPQYQGCLAMGGASQAQGDVEVIYCPDPDNYDKFIAVGEITGREEQVETSFSGHYPLNTRSQVIKWAKARTPLAIHVHFGRATNPSNFNVFEKAIIFDEGARITNIDIDEMGGLEESDRVGESADISAVSYYEVVPLNYTAVQGTAVDVVVSDVAIARRYDEYLPIDNRQAYYYALNGVTASKNASIVYSLDGGLSWASLDLTAFGEGVLSGVAIINDVVVVTGATGTDWYYADLLAGDTGFTAVAAGFVVTAISSNGNEAVIVGPSGAISRITDYTTAPTAIGLGASGDLLSVHINNEGVIIVGDDDGNVHFSADGTIFSTVDLGSDAVTAVFAVNTEVGWAGTDAGDLYFTTDSGATWTLRGFPGSGAGKVTDIDFPTLSVGFVAHQPATGAARIIKTVGGGALGTWYSVPRDSVLPTVYNMKLALMRGEPNILIAGGELVEDDLDGDGVAILGLE